MASISFLITKNFAQYAELLNFAGYMNGSNPQSTLFADGTFLYGTTAYGGTSGAGIVFKIKSDGTGYTTLHTFNGNSDGGYPFSSLVFDGVFLYGTTTSAGINQHGTIFKIKPDGSSFGILHNFGNDSIDGGAPYGSLFFDGTYLYGMTVDASTIFKIKPDGTGYSILYTFLYGNSDGWRPYGSLISDSTFLYGMTSEGGMNGDGTVFKIATDGTGYMKLLDFDSLNGRRPYGSLVLIDDFLFGTTRLGGSNDKGVIFKIKQDGTSDSVVYNFGDSINGALPYSGAPFYDGTFLYGMTMQGGINGNGVLFKVKINGENYTKLIELSNVSNQFIQTVGSPISDGTFLYGMTMTGGFNNIGTVFKYNPSCIPVLFSQSPFLCSGQSITVGNHNYASSGVYIDTINTINICDSIITTYLTVNNVTVSVSNTILTANAVGATYQWINCNNGNVTIAGQTNQNYFAPDSGSYAVIVTQNFCSDTSICYTTNTVGIIESANATEINIFPNPTNGKFTVDGNGLDYELSVANMLGELIYKDKSKKKKSEIDLSQCSEGIYYITLQLGAKKINKKLIIEK